MTGTKEAKDTKTFGSLCLLVLCCGTLAAAAGPSKHERALARDLDRIFTAPVMAHGLWGVEVRSLDSGRVLYAHNPQTLMMPASNMKILTLAAAAETLGWDYRFTTRLAASADVAGGALTGDLFVVGGGDPTINRRGNRGAAVFDEWAAALKSAGITRIDGNVIADGSAFDAQQLGQGWSWDYLQYGYAAPVSALEYNENVAVLSIKPGSAPGDQAWLELPPGTGLGLIHHLVTGAAGSATSIEISRDAGEKWLDVRGSIAVDAPPATRDVAVANPSLYFAHALTTALIDRGISVRGLPRDRQDADRRPLEPAPRRILVESQSPPLRDIATTMMKVSQNLYAETLLKAMGAARSGTGSAEAGRSAAAGVLSAWGVAPENYVQVDGSGLSRYDYVTPDVIVTLLAHLYGDPRHREAFVATLPVAGTDGTIASRLKHTHADGNATAKTGSISNARALSGYVRTRDGETLAFSILANSFAIPAATVNYVTDVAVETLANYSGR
jgi:D-alanyl-D-alanine carboxypeptidase/D-alanyl-D-alanine-endopeptidase (penicillin-binding protein 4)